MRKAPIHPMVIYIVMENHLGILSTPKRKVKNMPSKARNQATPKKDQPITVSWRNTRQSGVKVPAIRGYIAK